MIEADESPAKSLSQLNLQGSESINSSESEDDFGDFDEYDEPTQESTTLADQQHITETENTDINDIKTDKTVLNDSNVRKPLQSSKISQMSVDEIQNLLTPPQLVDDDFSAEEYADGGGTQTSLALWQHLTEPSWMPLPKWEGSPMHRQLVVHLGIPLNLDATLPKTSKNSQESLLLPTLDTQYFVDGLQNIPHWSISIKSLESLGAMSKEELEDHISHIQGILDKAQNLKDTMESKEMDLIGEKNILEGMVESLLVFSQRKQYDLLKKKATKG